jgi:hypothetical protein
MPSNNRLPIILDVRLEVELAALQLLGLDVTALTMAAYETSPSSNTT